MQNTYNSTRPLTNEQLFEAVKKLSPASQAKPDSTAEHQDDQPDVALQLSSAAAGEGGKGGEGGEMVEDTGQATAEMVGKGGEEGAVVAQPLDQVEGETPPLPPSPPFPAPAEENVVPVRPSFSAEGTYFPAPGQKSLAALQELIREFHFAAPEDQSAALCAMLTAAVRPSLPLAPAVNVTATVSGSGKSYLANGLVAFAGPGQPLTMSYPSDSVEAGKAMLSALMTGPAAILFDDMQGDWLPHGVMNRLLTSPTISDRLMGGNRMGTARTQSLIIGTGNNIAPVRDMNRRVLTIHLAPPSSAPATLRYTDRPVERVLAERSTYVAHALTIVQAYLQAGAPKADLPPIGSFEAWSDLSRQPLCWLGLPDPASSLLEQLREDPDLSALSAFLQAWQSYFWEDPVPVRKVIKEAAEHTEGRLYEALMDLPVTERGYINHSKLGWFIKKNAGRVANGLAFVRVKSSERLAWKVVEMDDRAQPRPTSPSSPASPPFSKPSIADDDDEIVF